MEDIVLHLRLCDQEEKKEDKVNIENIINNITKQEKYTVPKDKDTKNVTNNKKEKIICKRTVRISNVPDCSNEEELFSLFNKYGNIKRMDTKSIIKKGYGFVTYYDVSSATDCIKEMDKYKYNYSILSISN